MLDDDVKRQIAQTIRVASQAFEEWRPLFESARATFLEHQEELKTAGAAIAAFRAQHFEALRAMQPGLQAIAEAYRHIPEQERVALRVWARHGWYVDSEMSPREVHEIAEVFASGRTEEANKDLTDYFAGRAANINRVLQDKYSRRSHLLGAAFAAHERQDYACSIPLLLAQADGICSEVTGVQLYKRKGKDRLPALAWVLEDREEGFLVDALMAPLIEPTPISANATEREGLGSVLNRHEVLHGESVDYDTLANSCRAISLIHYVDWILEKSPRPSEEAS